LVVSKADGGLKDSRAIVGEVWSDLDGVEYQDPLLGTATTAGRQQWLDPRKTACRAERAVEPEDGVDGREAIQIVGGVHKYVADPTLLTQLDHDLVNVKPNGVLSMDLEELEDATGTATHVENPPVGIGQCFGLRRRGFRSEIEAEIKRILPGFVTRHELPLGFTMEVVGEGLTEEVGRCLHLFAANDGV
jgi:hypothetical protein